MSEDELSPRESVELLVQARGAVDAALTEAIAGLPEAERAEFQDTEVEGFRFRRGRVGLVQINFGHPGDKVALNPQPLPPGGSWVSLNPQPLPPKTAQSGIIIVSG